MVSIEPQIWIARYGAEHHKYGDPFITRAVCCNGEFAIGSALSTLQRLSDR